jgi:hypothetical protein
MDEEKLLDVTESEEIVGILEQLVQKYFNFIPLAVLFDSAVSNQQCTIMKS